MTSSTGTDPHPEVPEISALSEGLLSPDRTSQVRAHLGDCQVCADVLASLEEIRGLLGTLPGPARMPADIAGRIDAALAAQALLEATTPVDVSRETTIEADAGHVSRETPGTRNGPRGGSRPEGRPHDSTSPGRPPRVSRRWITAIVGAACMLTGIMVGGVMVQATGSASNDASAKKAVAEKAAPREGEPTFSAERLPVHVQELLANADSMAAPSPEMGTQSNPHTTLREQGTALPPCVREGIGRSEAPIAAQRGSFHGAGAYLVILPHVSDTTRIDAYIVGSSCVGRSLQGPGDVLLRQTYERD